jgi:hypothetical protein
VLFSAPPSAQGGADSTFDLHFRVYCDPPAGLDLCFDKSGWKTASDIRAAFQKRVMPVLNRIYEPTHVSFRLYDLSYDTTHPQFAAVKTPGKLDPPDLDADAIRDMREIARLPGNAGRIQVFVCPPRHGLLGHPDRVHAAAATTTCSRATRTTAGPVRTGSVKRSRTTASSWAPVSPATRYCSATRWGTTSASLTPTPGRTRHRRRRCAPRR